MPQERINGRGAGKPKRRSQKENQDIVAVVAPERLEWAGDESPAPLREGASLADDNRNTKDENPDCEDTAEDFHVSTFFRRSIATSKLMNNLLCV